MIARAFWCALLLGGLVSTISCRDITVCASSELCRASGADGGSAEASAADSGGAPSSAGAATASGGRARGSGGGSGGRPGNGAESGKGSEGGEAGEGGTRVCEPPLANCDRTWLNGCESDLSSDAYHCGHCDSVCDGVCSRSQCRSPVTLTERPINPLSPFAVTTDYLYFMWGDDAGPYRLSRVDRLGGEPQIVVDNLPAFSQIAADQGRVYLWGTAENLRSVSAYGEVSDEGFEVTGVAPQSDAMYAGSRGALLERKAGSSAWQPTPWFETEGGSVDLLPVNANGSLVVLRSTGDDRSPEYEVVLVERPDLPDGGLQTLARGRGTILRVRSLGDDVYWLVRVPNDSSDLVELHRHNTLVNSPEETLLHERDVRDFALDSHFAYVTRGLTTGYDLEIISLESISEKRHLTTRFEPTYPEAVSDLLWFFDTSKQRLSRVGLGLGLGEL